MCVIHDNTIIDRMLIILKTRQKINKKIPITYQSMHSNQ